LADDLSYRRVQNPATFGKNGYLKLTGFKISPGLVSIAAVMMPVTAERVGDNWPLQFREAAFSSSGDFLCDFSFSNAYVVIPRSLIRRFWRMIMFTY